MEAGDVAQQIVKAVAGHAAGGVHVDAVEALHDICMVGDLEIGHPGLAEALNLHVAAVVRPDGHAGVDHLGNDHHALGQLGVQLRLQLLQLGQPGGLPGYLGLDLLGLRQLGGILLGLAHKHADLLRQGVAVGPQLVGLGFGGPEFGIQLQHLVHQGQLGILELLPDVLPDGVGVFPYKFNVQHCLLSCISIIPFPDFSRACPFSAGRPSGPPGRRRSRTPARSALSVPRR